MKKKHALFENLKFEDFREMALSRDLSRYEKVGFPDAYRADQESAIFSDIASKLPALSETNSVILDIGCGCSDLPTLLMDRAQSKLQSLVLIDSAEMLSQLPDVAGTYIRKVPAKYPNCSDLLVELQGRVDAIIIYSVIQYIFADGNIFDFIDKSLVLLAPSGRMLIGDIPNVSMRKRFFSSENGIKHHQDFTGTNEIPDVKFNHIEAKHVDDSVIMSIVSRVRAAGFHAFIVPQPSNLPMANRREDILIVRP
jgi:cyclopropane fatty-acyl-phospholipid synthase-like methyltransferase